jgi:hypothetical protein
MTLKIKFLFALILLLSSFTLSAQSSKISGKIIDNQDKKPVIGATVVLYRVKDSTVVRGLNSDTEGKFTFSKIALGNYYLRISYVGYKVYKSQPITTSKQNSEINLNDITLELSTSETDQIEVVAEKQAIEYSMGKKVINVDKAASAVGGSALDVLRNVPSVDVDMDNNVSLRGNQNVNIMIDGKPLALMGGSTMILQQIPSAMVESVELVTNPSAKYDAEGQTGIINIITKKQVATGFNGIVNSNIGTIDNYMLSTNLNYRTGFFNIFTNLDYNTSRGTRRTEIFRRSTIRRDTTTIFNNIDRLGERARNGNGFGAKLGIELNFSKQTSLNFSGNIRQFNENDLENTTNTSFNNGQLFQRFLFLGDQNSPFNTADFSTNFMHKFEKKGHELTFDAFITRNRFDNKTDQTNQFFNIATNTIDDNATYQLRNYLTSSNQNILTQLDYTEPFGKNGKLEAGLKYNFRSIDANFEFSIFDKQIGDFQRDTLQSNKAKYFEDVAAAYAMYSDKIIDDIDFQIGLRAENTISKVREVATFPDVTRSYINFFPNATINYRLDKLQSFQLSYSRRINRPQLQSFSPFIDKSDPFFWRTGNPNINPEYINSYQFGYLGIVEKLTINTDIFVKDIRGAFNPRFRTFDSINNILTDRPVNIGQGLSYGLDFNIAYDIIKNWKSNLDLSFFNQKVEGTLNGQTFKNEGFSWNSRLTLNGQIWEDIGFQFFTSYNAPVVSIQGTRRGMYWFDVSLKKDFLEKKLTATLRWSDIGQLMRMGGSIRGEGFSSDAQFWRNFNSINLGFTYKINDAFKQREKRRQMDGMGGGMDDF